MPGLEYARRAYYRIIMCKFSKKWDVDETYYATCRALVSTVLNESNSQLTYFFIDSIKSLLKVWESVSGFSAWSDRLGPAGLWRPN